ncbi:alpha/beta hydrolase [uncultured Methylobacterium sp.]|uniref:alpha/beta hydrolase n=1 Tax=uncultured Methylobacterium sp. TaxID=157278 RepID=UPI0035CC2443
MLTLADTPGNPVPPGGTVMTVGTSDDCTLRAARWQPTARTCKGTVCLLQGRAEFIEKYYETIRELRARGFAVVAFDWRGQGASDRRVDDPHKGHVESFDDYRLDLLAIRDAVLVPLMPDPHVCLAHSTGGCVALTGALEGWLPFRRIVTVAPMLSIRMVRWPAFAAVATRALRRLGLGSRYIPGGGPTSIATKPYPNNRLSRDPARYARNAAAAEAVGAGAVGDPTIAWTAAAFRATARLADPRVPPRIATPTLIVAAGADPVCSTPAAERFAARLKAGHILVLPDARHEILSERDAIRADFWAAFDAFVPGSPVRAPEAAERRAAASATA